MVWSGLVVWSVTRDQIDSSVVQVVRKMLELLDVVSYGESSAFMGPELITSRYQAVRLTGNSMNVAVMAMPILWVLKCVQLKPPSATTITKFQERLLRRMNSED